MAKKEIGENLHYATGRRKEAVAQVRLKEGGDKTFLVNETPLEKYFTRETSKMIVNQPLELTNLMGQFEIWARVTGGGPNGQAGALRLAISRALIHFKEELRP